MRITNFFTLLIATAFLFSCSNDDSSNDQPLGDYDNGVLILNEGNFGVDNSTISYLSNDMETFQADAYGTVNNEAIGNTGQSIGFYQNLAFIVLNGSNKIVIANRYSLEKITTITTGLSNPRYIAFANGKAYVTNWGNAGVTTDDYVAVINLLDYSIETNISVVEGPEKIIEENNKLYVADQGGYGFGNAISVIDATTNAVTTTISVGDVPNSLEVENGYLYVLCSGKPSWSGTETSGELNKIKLSDNTTTTMSFTTSEHPSNLRIEDNVLYFTKNASVYKMAINATTLPANSFIDVSAQGVYGIYGFEVENNKIFIADAKDYSSNGAVYIYNVAGTFINEFEVKVIPSGFYFN